MKKLKRLLLTLIVLAILVLVAVLAYNAIKFSSKQVKIDPAPDLPLLGQPLSCHHYAA